MAELRFYSRNGAIQINRPARIANHHSLKSQPPRIQRRVAHAKIVSQAYKKHPRQPALAQIARKPCRCNPIILIKRRIGIDERPKPLAQYQLGFGQNQVRMKIRSSSLLHAMIRPQRLRSIAQLNLLIRLLLSMRTRKRSMPRRMPILCENHMLKARRNSENRLNDRVSAHNGQLPAGAEIILHVDHEKYIGGGYGYLSQLCSPLQVYGGALGTKSADFRRFQPCLPSPTSFCCILNANSITLSHLPILLSEST